MILDRLKAQKDVMKALGVQLMDGFALIEPNWASVPRLYLALDNDDCPGSALLLVRCMRWLEDKDACPNLFPIGAGWSLTTAPRLRPVDALALTMCEAALLAVLEAAEGK